MTAATAAPRYNPTPMEPTLTPLAPAMPARPWYRQVEPVTLLLLSICMVAPIWCYHYFPTTDGPAHLANADVLLHWFRADGDTYRKFYELNTQPVPNAMGHWVLAGLMLIFPALVAEKIVVSAYIILMPLAARYALRGVRAGSGFLAFLALPLTINYVFHQGFYNFCSSVVAFFFVMGYWLRRRDDMTIGRTVVLALLAALLYNCHLFALNAAVISIAVIGGWQAFIEIVGLFRSSRLTTAAFWRSIQSRCVLSGLAFVPMILLARRFKFNAQRHLGLFDAKRWIYLFRLEVLVSYRFIERYATIALAATFFLLVAGFIIRKVLKRKFELMDGVIFVPAAFAGLYFLYSSPTADIYFIPTRLSLFFYLGLLLWLAVQEFAPAVRAVVRVVGIAVAATLTVLHVASYRDYNTQIADYVDTARQIEPRTTLLSVLFAPRGLPLVSDDGMTVLPFYMIAGYVTAEKQAVDMRNYEAKEFYFPVRFKAATNPYELMAINEEVKDEGYVKGFDHIPQRFDVAGYTARTGLAVDYIITTAVPPELVNHPDTLKAFAQVNAGYDKIAESPLHLATLYRRKGFKGATTK